MNEYTHDFKFKINSSNISGECEFNSDGEASFNTKKSLPQMTVTQHHTFNRLFQVLKEVFKAYGSIEKIEVTKK